uniref:Ig-like domain-containing protein n=1 Tax=Cyprinus carpio carpio TaxID=630221 RepID=A0A8C1CZ58_CYPCA
MISFLIILQTIPRYYTSVSVCSSDVYVADEVKSVLVMEGDSLTLNPDLNQTQGFKMIQWWFGDISPVIAEIYANETSYPNDEIFRDRLELNQTGSLSIKNTRTTDSGLYKLEVQHNSGASYMTFSVTVYASGLSPGAKAGIVVVVLLVFAAAAIDMMCYHCFFSDLKKLKRLLVMEGETVILKPDIKVKRDDEILWKFGPQGICIAEIREGAREIFDFGDGEFKGRLTLDQTGSLTITNTRTTDSGAYELQMKRSSGVSDEIFCVNVCGYVEEETKFVMKGRYITLSRFNKEIQKNELIVWMFGDQETLIAQMTGGSRKTFDGPDGRFRGRLKLDKRTGDLTIRRMKCEHTGHYKLQISCSS